MFKPITIEEIKDRLVFSHDQVFHAILKQVDGGKIFSESFTFTTNYNVIVMGNHDLSWKPLGSTPQDLEEYLRSLKLEKGIELIGLYEYETE